MAFLVNVKIYTRFSLKISASPHQLDLAPYASEPYHAQWNAPGLLRDKHTLRSSRILGEMEVDEPWLGLWLPLNYQVDMGSSLAYDNGIWGEPYRLFAAKFLFVGVFFFWFVLKVVFVIGSAVDRLCG